ncbi:shikimate kinase [Oscillospiraceae bacterium OttesenSCG-928-G22]|nr:shikimate kinase [Oscillospiraceae bacterium OttesenSCG-928-G22]
MARCKGVHIYLIGLPGVGKTTLGAAAAPILKLPFYDLDDIIEKTTGKSISQLFVEGGEGHFRAIESEQLAALSACAPGIVSTGGGTPLADENAAILRTGLVVLIDRPLVHVASDISRDNRPLLQNDEGAITRLFHERRERYLSFCDIHIVNDRTALEGFALLLNELRRSLEKWGD